MLETITLDRDTQHYKEIIALRYAELVYFGQWFTPLREALDAFVDKTQENVTGDVRLKLYKGNMINAGVTSPYSLYSEAFATFDEDEVYNQKRCGGLYKPFRFAHHGQGDFRTGTQGEKQTKLTVTYQGGYNETLGRALFKRSDQITNDFNSSIAVDSRMFAQDIDGSIAHAQMLGAKGIISGEDSEKLRRSCRR